MSNGEKQTIFLEGQAGSNWALGFGHPSWPGTEQDRKVTGCQRPRKSGQHAFDAVSTQNGFQELGVRYVMEGSVRRAGDRLRVTAQLIDAATGHHVWAERYDRPLADIFDIQDEITRSVAASTETQVLLAERHRQSSQI